MKKKVLFLALDISGGGAERIASYLLKYLNRDKYELELVILNDIVTYKLPEDIKVTCLNKRKAIDFFKLTLKLSAIIRRKKPDIAVSFLTYPNIMLVLAGKIARFKGKVVITEHNNPILAVQKRMDWLWKLLKRVFYLQADRIIAVSKGVLCCLSECFRVPKDKIVVIYNGVDHSQIIEQSQNENSEDESITRFISIGRLTKQKAYQDMLKAFKKVLEKRKATLTILGEGEQEQSLKELCADLGITEHVKLNGFERDPFVKMSKSDVFLFSSHWEGFGNVIVEAMACGLPVISTDCPFGPSEIIENGKNGILVPVGDIDAMADSMLKLIDNGELREQIANQGKIRSQDFTVSKMIGKYEDVLDSICEKV